MRAVCADYRDRFLTPRRLSSLGVDGVRLVAFPDGAFFDKVHLLHGHGFKIALVRARESDVEGALGHYVGLGPFVDQWLIGNEPNNVGPASWTMDPASYALLFNKCSAAIEGRCYVGGHFGGASSWLEQTVGLLEGCVGIDCHYPVDVAALESYGPYQDQGLRLSCMEWSWSGAGVTAEQVTSWQKVLSQHTLDSAWFCLSWWEGSEGMELLTRTGKHRRNWYNYHAALLA